MGIYIDVYGNIELRIPTRTPEGEVDALVQSKWNWIIEKSDEMKEKTKGFREKDYKDKETLLLLGENIPVTIEVDISLKKPIACFKEDHIQVTTPNQDQALIQKALTRFYKKKCKEIIEKRIAYYQPNFKVKPRSIRISSNKKSWGTCNNLKELTFNWKLAMAPLQVVDYVVVHEMCHMIHLNHDRSFWRLVGKYMPDYETCQAWLRESHWKMVV